MLPEQDENVDNLFVVSPVLILVVLVICYVVVVVVVVVVIVVVVAEVIVVVIIAVLDNLQVPCLHSSYMVNVRLVLQPQLLFWNRLLGDIRNASYLENMF